MNTAELIGSKWFLYLDEKQKMLVKLSLDLYDKEKANGSGYEDYSFVLFPMSKAYEGFLKKYLKDLNLISEKVYLGRRFRIGRALNPDINHNQHDEYWLFDDLEDLCGNEIARQLWDAWLTCRNRVFHYFPAEASLLTLDMVAERIKILSHAMDAAVECKLSSGY